MTKIELKSQLKSLEKDKDIQLTNLNWLLYEYREYQSYFKNCTPSEAEEKFYQEKSNQAIYDWGESESRYSIEHISLSKRIKENRIERSKITTKISEINTEIKNILIALSRKDYIK